jgi:HK97 family phage major capsid protein
VEITMQEHLTIGGQPLAGVHTLDRDQVNAELARFVDQLEDLKADGQQGSVLFAALAERCEALDRRLDELATLQPSRERLRELAFGTGAATERGAFAAVRRGDPLRRQDRSTSSTADEDGRELIVRSGETLGEWGIRTGRAPSWGDERGLHFGKIVRGLATGDWADAPDEERAMSESPVTAGGHLVPAPLAASLIDRARSQAVLTQLGAQIVPMTSATLKIPKIETGLTGANLPDWRNENDLINDKAITLNAVTLTARSLACMVKVSWELIDDAPGCEDVIRKEFANQFACEFDRVGLYGTGTAPQPRGVKNTSGISPTPVGANGAVLSSWDWLIDAQTAIRTAGWEPTGAIFSPRTEGSLAKLREAGTTGPYLQLPPAVATFPRRSTMQIPNNLTVGSSNITSDAFVAAWSTVLIGTRVPLRIRVLEERYADYGQVAFLADLRGDIAVAQPSAVQVLTGIL